MAKHGAGPKGAGAWLRRHSSKSLQAKTSRRLEAPRVEPFTVNLANLYVETQPSSGDECSSRLVAMLGAEGVIGRPTSWHEAAEHVLPALRATSWAAAMGTGVLRRLMLPFVELLAAIDSGTTIARVSKTNLGTTGAAGLVSRPVRSPTWPLAIVR
ncbi:MAG: hypothetical protein ACYDH5_14955 [Acidimicrobiales bacterium]